MKYYVISEADLFEVLVDSYFLQALEEGRVDQWPYYNYAIMNFLDSLKDKPSDKMFGFKDLAKQRLEVLPHFELNKESN